MQWLPHSPAGFERLSVLGNLETLQLGQNKFNSSILSSLGGLSSLKYLFLHNNEIEGAISVEGDPDFIIPVLN